MTGRREHYALVVVDVVYCHDRHKRDEQTTQIWFRSVILRFVLNVSTQRQIGPKRKKNRNRSKRFVRTSNASNCSGDIKQNLKNQTEKNSFVFFSRLCFVYFSLIEYSYVCRSSFFFCCCCPSYQSAIEIDWRRVDEHFFLALIFSMNFYFNFFFFVFSLLQWTWFIHRQRLVIILPYWR